ncbi:MAG: class II glutamine amidotransferase [Nitrososphaeria archaeon]
MALLRGKKDFFLDVYRAVAEAARFDDFAVSRGFNSHPDGWGLVATDGRWLVYIRSLRPVWVENYDTINDTISVLRDDVYAIFHARRASLGMTGRIDFQHPMRIIKEDGEIYMAHNGFFRKDALKKAFPQIKGIDDSSLTDTQLFAKIIGSIKGSSEDAIEAAVRALKPNMYSGLANMLFMVIYGRRITGLYFSDYSEDLEYNRLYLLKKEDLTLVASSTVLLKMYGSNYTEAASVVRKGMLFAI